MGLVVHRFEVWLVDLDPTRGAEMRKARPALVVSPDEMNGGLLTVMVAPLTTGGFEAPFRVPCRFAGRAGQVALDHLRAVDKRRLVKRLGVLDDATAATVLATLREMFA